MSDIVGDLPTRLRLAAKSLRGLAPMWRTLYAKSAENADDSATACEKAADELDQSRKALEKYRDDYCEGWCKENGGAGHFNDCGGCPAARALSRGEQG